MALFKVLLRGYKEPRLQKLISIKKFISASISENNQKSYKNPKHKSFTKTYYRTVCRISKKLIKKFHLM
jgi:hypothetical protein